MHYNFLKYIGKLSLILCVALACALPAPSCHAAAAEPEDAPAEEDVGTTKDTAPPAVQPDSRQSAASFGDYLAGRFALSQGDAAHGVQYLRDSLKRDPDNKDAMKSLYRMLVFSGDIEGALPLARKLQGMKVVDEGSELSPEILLAIDEVSKGEYEAALERIAPVAQTGYKSLELPLMRAWLKLGAGEVKAPLDAKDMMAQGSHVLLPQMYLNAGFINDLAGFDAQARKQYETAVKDPRVEPFRAVEALANFYQRKGMADKREALVRDYLSAHGESYLSGELLQPGKGRPEPLVKDAREGVAETLYTMVTIFHGLRAPGDEIALLHLALYLRPHYPPAQFLLAGAYEMGQQYPQAIEAYKAIDPASPYSVRGRIRSVYDEMELGRKDAALAELDAIAAQNPEEVDALLAKGDILRSQKQYKEAVDTYTALLGRIGKLQQKHWLVYFSRGATYQLMGQWDKAESDMRKALELSPRQPEVLNYLGYSWLTKRQDVAQARKMIEEAYEARPEDAEIIDSMGYALYVGGDYAGAEDYFEQALERTPDDATVNDHLGDTYWQLGRKTEARYQWERALQDSPDDETEKGLRKKLKEGMGLVPPTAAANGKSDPLPTAEE